MTLKILPTRAPLQPGAAVHALAPVEGTLVHRQSPLADHCYHYWAIYSYQMCPQEHPLGESQQWGAESVRTSHAFYRKKAGAPDQWVRTYPSHDAPFTGEGVFDGDVLEVEQVVTRPPAASTASVLGGAAASTGAPVTSMGGPLSGRIGGGGGGVRFARLADERGWVMLNNVRAEIKRVFVILKAIFMSLR